MVALAGSVNGLGGLLKKITVPVLVMHLLAFLQS
jgi:hypothetical protein